MRKRPSKSLKFHESYLITSLGFILTGYYLNLIVYTSLIIIHELGHYLTARLLHIKIKNITIYPFGGITKLDTLINLNINKELLVSLSGIIIEFLFYLIICYLNKINIIRDYTMNLYTTYNSSIIFFNLLPIYPLDGSKILNLLLSKITPFRISNIITIILSLITLIILLSLTIYTYNYSNILIYILLIINIIKFYQKRNYIYNKFLLERYLYHLKYPKIKLINNYHNMYKDKTHLIKNIKEEIILRNLFK